MLKYLLLGIVPLFACSLCLNTYDQENSCTLIPTIYEATNIKKAYDYNSEMFIFGGVDVISYQFYKNMEDFTVNNIGVGWRDGTETLTYLVSEITNIKLIHIDNINYDTPGSTPTYGYLNGLSFATITTGLNNCYIKRCAMLFNPTFYYVIEWRFATPPDNLLQEDNHLEGYLLGVRVRSYNEGSYGDFSNYGFLMNRYSVGEDLFNVFSNFQNVADENNTIYNQGYNNGYASGYSSGTTEGYNNGYQVGNSEGLTSGYQNGYNQALDDMAEQSSTANTIFNGIFTIALLPVDVFLKFMDFEVFGINISGLASGLITMALIMILVNFILGRSNGKSKD